MDAPHKTVLRHKLFCISISAQKHRLNSQAQEERENKVFSRKYKELP